MDAFGFLMPARVMFGNGVFERLGDCCRELGAKPLLVTGRHSARATGLLERVLAQLPGAVVFDDVPENPTDRICDAGAELCRKNGCDLVAAVGGGSPMDAAKAIAGLALNDGPCARYFGTDRFTKGCLPIVAAPTTAGTGSEVTPYAVLVSEAERTKRTIAGRGLFPSVALVDPELSLTMPHAVTANTGLDALSQAMEGYVSKKSTPITGCLALEACRIVRDALPAAVANGRDLDARGRMLYAALLSGMVIAQTGTTLVHGMGYYLTGEFGIAHGLANGLLLAPVFRYNARFAPGKVAALAEALGCPAAPEPGAAAEAITQALKALFNAIGVSCAARDAGAREEHLPWCADTVHADRSRFKNQFGDPTRDEVLGMYIEAQRGL